GDAPRGQLERVLEVRSVRPRVRDDEVRPAKRAPVERAQGGRAQRATRDDAAVVDQRVPKRDERVEDDGSTGGDALRGGHVGMTGIPDDEEVRVAWIDARERDLGAREPRERPEGRRPVVPPPDLLVAL